MGGGFGDKSGPRRAAALVADDAELFTFASQALHGEQEVLTAGTIDPAEPEDEMVRAGSLHAKVAFELSAAIGT